jgi:hypothetical protein
VPSIYSQSVSYHLTLFLARVISSTLKMEVTHSSEMLVYNKPHPKDSILKFICYSVALYEQQM